MAKDSKEVGVYKFYKINNNSIERLKRECPRCGKGVYMAEHKDRYTCGRCGYTEFQKDHSKKPKSK